MATSFPVRLCATEQMTAAGRIGSTSSGITSTLGKYFEKAMRSKEEMEMESGVSVTPEEIEEKVDKVITI